mgnify:FL=1
MTILVEKVRKRKDCIDYAMFDPSHGTNSSLDLNSDSLAIRFGREIISDRDLGHLGIIFAGGINPRNVATLKKILHDYLPRDRVSIDVESGVRKDDCLDLALGRDYLLNNCR